MKTNSTNTLGVSIENQMDRLRYLFEGIDLETALNPTMIDPYLRGHVVGYKLDNAFGDMLNIDAIREGYQEYILVLETAVQGRFRKDEFNVADLVAIIRSKIDRINQAYPHYMDLANRLAKLTENCRPDMHEPDEQGVVLFLRYSVINTSPDDPHMMKFEFHNRITQESVNIDHGVFLRFLLA